MDKKISPRNVVVIILVLIAAIISVLTILDGANIISL